LSGWSKVYMDLTFFFRAKNKIGRRRFCNICNCIMR
jgi:hypothetical protein